MQTKYACPLLIAHSSRMSVAAIATSMLIAAAANAQLTTWSYGGSMLQYVDTSTDPPTWQDYSPAPTVGTSPLAEGLKIFGTGPGDQVFSLTGADYVAGPTGNPDFRGNQLVIAGTGTIDGAAWQHPADYIRTTFGIGLDFTGGSLAVYKAETSYVLLDGSDNFLTGVGSGFGEGGLGVYEPGGHGVGFAFEDRFGSNYETAEKILWSVTIGYDWTGMSSGDTFTFSIPQNSIDIQTLPEPASIAMLGLGGVVALIRRRRSSVAR